MLIRPASKVVIKFLQLMQKHGYIGEFEFVDDHRAGKIVVELNGRLNKCGVISPRYDIGHSEVCVCGWGVTGGGGGYGEEVEGLVVVGGGWGARGHP